jgi:hypothetical protein
MLYLAVPFGRDLRSDAAVTQILSDLVAVVALVGQDRTWIAGSLSRCTVNLP